MKLLTLVQSQIEDLFDSTSNDMDAIHRLRADIESLNNRLEARTNDMQRQVATLLCLSAVDVRMHGGRMNKIPLIKVYRACHGCGLKEAKDLVEAYIIPDNDIPF